MKPITSIVTLVWAVFGLAFAGAACAEVPAPGPMARLAAMSGVWEGLSQSVGPTGAPFEEYDAVRAVSMYSIMMANPAGNIGIFDQSGWRTC